MEEAQSQRASDPGQQQPSPSELDVWVHTVGGRKKGRIYGLGLESTALIGPSYQYGQGSSQSHWMQSQEFQEQVRRQVEAELHGQVRKQVEEEWNSRVEAAEHERDELRRRVEHNERLLHELMTKINFQPSSSQPSPLQPSPSQPPILHPYHSDRAPVPQYGPSDRGRDDDDDDDDDDDEEEEEEEGEENTD